MAEWRLRGVGTARASAAELRTGFKSLFQCDFSQVRKGTPLPDYIVKYYVDRFASSPDELRGSFEWYRAIDTDTAQNEQRKTRRLTLPVLAVGGSKSGGEGAAKTLKLVADNVQTAVIPGSGHWVAEESPDKLLAVLIPFLAPYRAAR